MLTKNADVLIKAGPADGLNEGEFTAYASVFGNKDAYGDIVVQGAFGKTLAAWAEKGSPIPLLFGHRLDDPDYNIGHVVSAAEDDHGLKVTAQLDLENPKAMQTYRLLKGKRIDQMSFAYDVVDAEKTDDAYLLKQVDVYEISVVPIGANQETEVLAVKAAADALLHGAKAGRVISAKNESELRKAHEAIGNVLAAMGKDSEEPKASGHTEAKSDASDEEPPAVKSPAEDEEPRVNPSARVIAEQKSLLLKGVH